jgi:flagellar M-ring protein FliF
MTTEMQTMPSVLAPLEGMTQLSYLRQFGLLAGLAASVALGVYIVLWSQTPNYGILFTNLNNSDQSQVVEELQRGNINYRIDTSSGAVMVPVKDINDARLGLAKAGLPDASHRGFSSIVGQDNQFGSSQQMESARYQHALEVELAHSIQSINLVKAARVHLAIPKQSAFLRNRMKPSASVFINLYPGRELDKGHVAAIRNLVAASIAGLAADQVTVVDQMGRLMSSRDRHALNTEQFDYTRQLEDIYVSRIEALLTPIIGPGGVRAQVALDMDYSVTEQTEERFLPDTKVVRSERVEEKRKVMNAMQPGGVAGALSNEPPEIAGKTEALQSQDKANPGDVAEADVTRGKPTNASMLTLRNYEMDKTIRHTRASPGGIRKISVAIVVDNKQVIDDKGKIKRMALSEEEIERLQALVKETVGFNAGRGDSVHVFNTAFITPPAQKPLPKPSLLQQPWIWDVGKQIIGFTGFLLLLFGVMRPVLRSLAARTTTPPSQSALAVDEVERLGMKDASGATAVRRGNSYEAELDAAKSIANQDPKRVAQVVKNWVTDDA